MLEIITPQIPRAKIRCAVFDFDGTLSLLRAGWDRIMQALMLDALRATPHSEDVETLQRWVEDFILQSSGQQTIYQMMRLAEEVQKRGGVPQTPQAYKQMFVERLLARVNERVTAMRAGHSSPEEWCIAGSHTFLAALRARSVTCYIVSGTDEEYVKSEAALLNLTPYIAEIFGAHADYRNHSKKVVIRQLVARHQLQPGELVTFGDGAPEMADTKAVGGIAVGVASNEETRNGVDPRKRAVLVRAGADAIIPDYRARDELLEWLFGRTNGSCVEGCEQA
ncbi:MAG: haloacid dehalogenase-like hydrolase [Anaerolineae bacterium]|nr:haloacid dehalogenase-like hydrolase [Anaerolineae bacterium]